MKRIISLLLVAALLLTMGCFTAFADGAQPTSGPWTGFNMMFGGARLGFSSFTSITNKYVLNYDYGTQELMGDNEAMPGATYDKASNTLTIKDLNASDYSMFVWFMGDDFKLKIEGDCSVGVIYVYNYMNAYSSSLSIIGTGKLTINEKKNAESAIVMYSSSENSTEKLSIADSVTVDAYAGSNISGDNPVITVGGAAENGVTAGGKLIEGLKSEQVKVIKTTVVDIAMPYPEEYNTYSYEAKSKSDPDGIYGATFTYGDDDNITGYRVRKYLPVPGYDNMYVTDLSMGEGGSKRYSAEDFNKEFTLVTSPQPKEADVTSEWREKNVKGETGIRLKNTADPEGFYLGSPAGTWEPYSFENPQGYYIYRVTWDEEEGMYVEDTSFEVIDVRTEELAEKGYEIVYETKDVVQELDIWVLPAPYEEPNWNGKYELLKRDSDPDGIYVQTGTYYTQGDNGEHLDPGILVDKVFYDEENDVYYTDIYANDPEINFHVSDESMEDGTSEFKYDTKPEKVQIKERFLPDDYEIWQYGNRVTLLTKADEPGEMYCCIHWDYTENGVKHDDYTVYHMTYNEAEGLYYVDSNEDGEIGSDDMTLEEMTAAGYSFVTEPKPANLILDGYFSLYGETQFTDKNGKKYIVDNYPETVYAIDETRFITNGGNKYYILEEAPDVNKADLSDDHREELVNAWNYRLEENEYHFNGSGQASENYEVKGAITSYLSDKDVTVKLEGKNNDFTATVTGKDSYAIENVPDGEYTLSVEKKDHVDREYTITVNGANVTQDVKICPIGDANNDGKVNAKDSNAIMRHISKASILTDYNLLCANANGDTKVNAKDVNRILRHISKAEPLF